MHTQLYWVNIHEYDRESIHPKHLKRRVGALRASHEGILPKRGPGRASQQQQHNRQLVFGW